jgi:hypothetical protein
MNVGYERNQNTKALIKNLEGFWFRFLVTRLYYFRAYGQVARANLPGTSWLKP